jgi:NAD+ kinase
VKRVGFILKPDKPEAGQILGELVPRLIEQGHQPVVLDEDQVAPEGALIVPEEQFAADQGLDMAVVLGGDGTMLRASALVADVGVPVLGVNLGRLGFLTPFDPAEAIDAVEAALAGRLETSERMRLAVTYRPAGGEATMRASMNDVVLHQGAMARLIALEARLGSALITSYRADGLIVATPTGSTAYNLAAGGPILIPGQKAMTLTPICAHALTHRPLVIPENATLRIALGEDSRGVVLTVDGQWARSFLPGDEIEVTTHPKPLVVFQSGKGYFDILREKLHWGAHSATG